MLAKEEKFWARVESIAFLYFDRIHGKACQPQTIDNEPTIVVCSGVPRGEDSWSAARYDVVAEAELKAIVPEQAPGKNIGNYTELVPPRPMITRHNPEPDWMAEHPTTLQAKKFNEARKARPKEYQWTRGGKPGYDTR